MGQGKKSHGRALEKGNVAVTLRGRHSKYFITDGESLVTLAKRFKMCCPQTKGMRPEGVWGTAVGFCIK